MPMPNDWRKDIVLVEHFAEHLRELTEDGYVIFSSVQHSVDGYYLVVSYPKGTANQLDFDEENKLKVADIGVITAVNALTAVVLGGELPESSTGLATHELQHSGIDAVYLLRDSVISGNTSLDSIDNRVGTTGTTGTAIWELDQIRQKITASESGYTSGIILASQTGPNNGNGGNVLTFTFPQVMEKVHVSVVDTSNVNQQVYFRVDPLGGTPSSTAGMVGRSNNEMELHVRCSTVKVWFVGQHNCTVWGYYNA